MNPALEAIGGTGDLVTGVVSALLAASFPLARACSFACRISRLAGAFSRPTPATAISEILSFVPRAVKELLL